MTTPNDIAVHRIWLARTSPALPVLRARDHWFGVHADVFADMPDLLGYRQNRAVEAQWSADSTWLCSETWFGDSVTERSAFGSEYYRRQVAADEAKFTDRATGWGARVRDPHGALAPIRDRSAPLRILWFDETPAAGCTWSRIELDRPVPGGGSGSTLLVGSVADEEHALALVRSAPCVALLCRPTTVVP